MPSSIFPAVSTADVDAIIAGLAANPLSSNVIQIDGAATNANVATLNLKQLNIVNSAGSALIAQSTGSNGSGAQFIGNGSGDGQSNTGGVTGNGVKGVGGSTSGSGAWYGASGSSFGDGLHAETTAVDGDGINTTATHGTGIYSQGSGTSGAGIAAISVATSGIGLYVVGSGDNHGIGAFGDGGGAGMYLGGGATGHGLNAVAGATVGAGAAFESPSAEGLYGSGDPAIAAYGLGSIDTLFGQTEATIKQEWSKADIVTNTTTTIKSGTGFIHAININKGAATSTITVYDNTAGSGTKIGGVIVDTLAGGTSVILDSVFSTGLTVVTAGGAAADITVTYK